MMPAAVARLKDCNRHGGSIETSPNPQNGEVSNAALACKFGAIPPIAETGTGLAISYLTFGGAALSAGGSGRGGARNRADRESDALTAAQIGNLKAAERHAAKIGLPLNRMITIHWQAAGLALESMALATGRFTGLLTKAQARHGSKTAWLWVHENVPGRHDNKGGHCHLLAHVPADLVPVITGMQRGWLRLISGQQYRKGVILSRPIGARLGMETRNPDLHAVNLKAALSYVLKGASAKAAAQSDLALLEPGGRVIGKRCGTSQNIGAKARKAKDKA